MPKNARESSGWHGTSSAARLPAATSCTSASTWRRAREITSWRKFSRRRNVRGGWSTASSGNPASRRICKRARKNAKLIFQERSADEHFENSGGGRIYRSLHRRQARRVEADIRELLANR